MFKGMFTSIQRFFIWLGVLAEKASETDAINQAIVERGIRDQKAKADKAHYANGQLQSQILLLKDQVRKQEQKETELKYMLDHAAKTNDEANGSVYAEELANLEQDLLENKNQLSQLEEAYKQNTEIIAESMRQIQKAQREFETLKAKVAISRNMENLAQLMKSSVTELQGMIGGETASAMQRMREASVQGQGQITATMDLAKEMGSNIRAQQEARKARGKALFQEYKAKATQSVQAPVAETQNAPEKTKIAVPA